MDIGNIEAIAQALDVISFILVTPEFLREETLTSMRARLHRTARKLISDYTGDSDPRVGILLIIVGCIGLGLFWVGTLIIGPQPVYGFYFFMFLSAVQIAIGVWVIVLYLVGKLFFRRMFFVIGALVFFTTRVTLFWTHLSLTH